MKNLIYIFIICLLCSTSNEKKVFLEKIKIGKYSYSMYKKSNFSHDDNLNSDFYVVYTSDNKKRICSSYLKSYRNDSIFTKGIYSYNSKELIFKEYYFFEHSRLSDSMQKKFTHSKTGKLFLSEVINYKNGIPEKVK